MDGNMNQDKVEIVITKEDFGMPVQAEVKEGMLDRAKVRGREIAGNAKAIASEKAQTARTKMVAGAKNTAVRGTKAVVRGSGKAMQSAIASEVVTQMKTEAKALPGRVASGEFELTKKAQRGTVWGIRWLSQQLAALSTKLNKKAEEKEPND
jgi:hypothetical protein